MPWHHTVFSAIHRDAAARGVSVKKSPESARGVQTNMDDFSQAWGSLLRVQVLHKQPQKVRGHPQINAISKRQITSRNGRSSTPSQRNDAYILKFLENIGCMVCSFSGWQWNNEPIQSQIEGLWINVCLQSPSSNYIRIKLCGLFSMILDLLCLRKLNYSMKLKPFCGQTSENHKK